MAHAAATEFHDARIASENDAETNCYNIVCASYFQDNFENVDSILSTFTVSADNSNSYIRGLYDIGSQSSFITENALENVDYITLKDDINLTIKGINNTKTCKK